MAASHTGQQNVFSRTSNPSTAERKAMSAVAEHPLLTRTQIAAACQAAGAHSNHAYCWDQWLGAIPGNEQSYTSAGGPDEN